MSNESYVTSIYDAIPTPPDSSNSASRGPTHSATLYDNFNSTIEQMKGVAAKHEIDSLRAENAALREELAAKEKKLEAVVKQGAVLARNISTLYKTAHAEVTRKNREISELRAEIERLKKSKNPS